MRIPFKKLVRVVGAVALSLCLFGGGYVAGQNRFGQPKTIIHVVEIKWNPGVSAADKQRVLAGVKEMAREDTGIKMSGCRRIASSPATSIPRMPLSFKTETPPIHTRKASFTKPGMPATCRCATQASRSS